MTRNPLLSVGFAIVFVAALSPPAPAAGDRAETEVLPAPVTDGQFYRQGRFDPELVELGRLLFFDKILSGNMNISCATCHHPLAATGDGLSLPIGEGGRGLGGARDTGRGRHAVVERVPRNAPPIFNLGARRFRTMFHDGRVQRRRSEPSGFRSPAGADLPQGLDNVLAAQAMFPVTSTTEMAGQAGENEIADAAAAGNLPLVWERLETRLRAIPEYARRFVEVFDDVSEAGELRFWHAANAIAAFEARAWRADDSPFDRYLRGETGAMSAAARRGMRLFYGEMGCSSCHSGAFQTDHRFHAIAMPQIGPGKGDGPDGHEDHGRRRVTGRRGHHLKFRTPTLRNVAITGPWGHSGAYDSLRAVVEHHLDPVAALESYDRAQAVLPSRRDLDELDFVVLSDPARRRELADASELRGRAIRGREEKVDDLIEFLLSLTDPASLDLRADIPDSVPSGLPIAD